MLQWLISVIGTNLAHGLWKRVELITTDTCFTEGKWKEPLFSCNTANITPLRSWFKSTIAKVGLPLQWFPLMWWDSSGQDWKFKRRETRLPMSGVLLLICVEFHLKRFIVFTASHTASGLISLLPHIKYWFVLYVMADIQCSAVGILVWMSIWVKEGNVTKGCCSPNKTEHFKVLHEVCNIFSAHLSESGWDLVTFPMC